MNILNFYHYLNKTSYAQTGGKARNPPYLTKREKQVIFFFLANLSSQEIVDILYNLEARKVSKALSTAFLTINYISNLIANSFPALYKILQEMGYKKKISKELLTNSSVSLNILKPY
ncbi:hypothetical protein [Candidatus Coxiella mudrowiae]|nr:hypothetical protein [Candidatus Coxiella mudrowiae]